MVVEGTLYLIQSRDLNLSGEWPSLSATEYSEVDYYQPLLWRPFHFVKSIKMLEWIGPIYPPGTPT